MRAEGAEAMTKRSICDRSTRKSRVRTAEFNSTINTLPCERSIYIICLHMRIVYTSTSQLHTSIVYAARCSPKEVHEYCDK